MTYTLHSYYFLHVDDGIVMYSVALVQMFNNDLMTTYIYAGFSVQKMGELMYC
jgi:hypothetical protein